MTLFDTNSVGFSDPVAQNSTLTSAKTAGSPDQQKLQKAAGEFESMLLASMWKSMKQSFGTTEDASDPAHGTLDDWGIEIMSGAVGKAGGLGIGRLILNHLEPGLKKETKASDSGTGADLSTTKQGT
jgi:Rod binding domain-containing protein